MDWWQSVLITIATTLAGIITTDIVVRLKTTGKKALEKKTKERTDEMTAVVKTVCTELIKPVADEVKETKDLVSEIRNTDIEVLKKANRDSLRNELYDIYDRCIEYKTESDIENEAELWNSYKALKGNHGCDARHENFLRLLSEDQYFYNKRTKEEKINKK